MAMLPLPSSGQVKDFFQCCFQTDSDKLDPISILALTALMRFKEEDSKIHITGNHQVVIQQPSEFEFLSINLRGIFRFLQRASHEDLAIIKPSIEKAAKWYQPHLKENEEVKKLFKYAKKGLNALKKTYEDKSKNTTSALENWQDLIDTACERGLGPEEVLDATTKRVKALWNETDIAKVNLYLGQMYDLQGETPISLSIKCEQEISQLEYLLGQKAEQIRKIHLK